MSEVLRWPGRVALVVVAAVRSAADDFVVAAVRDGRLRTRGLPAGIRVALHVAVGLALATFASIVAAARWRSVHPQVVFGGPTLRGTLVPAPLVPVTLGVLAFAVALCLSGALRSGPWAAAGVGVLYAVVATFLHEATLGDDLLHRVAGWAIPAALVALVAVRHLRPRPVVELLGCLALVGLVFADAHRLLAATDHANGTDFLGGQADVLLADVLFLSVPLLVVAALNVVEFGVAATRWSVGFVGERLGDRWVLAGAGLLAAWRGRDLVREVARRVADDGWGAEGRALLGSAVLLALVVGAAALVRRRAGSGLADVAPQDATEAGLGVALPAAVALTAASLVVALLFLLLQASLPVLPHGAGAGVRDVVHAAVPRVGRFGGSGWWTLLRGLGAGVAAWWLARRGRSAPALVLATIGVVLVHGWATDPGAPLHAWTWTLGGVDVLVVAAAVASAGWWVPHRQLTPERAGWLLFLLLLTGLFRQGSFVSDPFAALLAFTGGAFVLFGLVWGFATGLSWANEGSAHLPRCSRAQLLLGYQLLSISILHWYLVTHDLDSLESLTDTQPGTGTALLGQPLLLLLFVVALAGAWAGRPHPAAPGGGASDG